LLTLQGDDGQATYLAWWHPTLKELEEHPLFINLILRHDRGILSEKKAVFDEVVEQGGNVPPAKLQMEIAQEELNAKYKEKVEREIYGTISKVLDRWRCSGVCAYAEIYLGTYLRCTLTQVCSKHQTSLTVFFPAQIGGVCVLSAEPPTGTGAVGYHEITCMQCANMWQTNPGSFSRDFCLKTIQEWRAAEMDRRGRQV